MKTLKGISYIALATVFLCVFLYFAIGPKDAREAFAFTFVSGSRVKFVSGAKVTSDAATGLITGYSTHPPSSDPALATYYHQLLAAGANYQRTDLPWSSVQSTSSASYVWGSFDTLVNEAASDGISTMLIIDSTPSWAATSSCASGCAPVNAATVATFAAAAASHYCGKVSMWEFWNEPNNNSNFGPTSLASDFTLDLNASYTAMKAACPGITIVSGALDSEFGTWNGTNWLTYTTQMLADGATFDLFGVHPYTYSLNVNDSFWGWCGTGNGVVCGTRTALNSAGDSAKQIIVTEYGAPTCGPSAVSFANQENEAAAMIATSTGASAAFMNLYPLLFWYTLVDANSNDPSTSQNCFGVYLTNGTPKPVYEVLRSNTH